MKTADIRKALQELSIACETISRTDGCKMCPLKDICIEEYSIVDTINKMDCNSMERMLCMAETFAENEEECNKDEYDRRWEASADYWNDRRCDPDYNEYD